MRCTEPVEVKREINIEFFNKNYYQLNVGIKSKEEQDRKINMMIDQYLLENPNYNPSNFIISSDETETGDTAFDEEYEIEYTFIKNRWLPVYKSEEKKNKFFRAKLESLFRESDDSVFRKYELKFIRQNASLLNVEIKTPKELEGLNFYIREDTDLTEFISEKVKDPFKYIRADQFNTLNKNIQNNIIINIVHIDYLNEEYKKNEADGRYIDKYGFIEKRIKKWFLEIDDFDRFKSLYKKIFETNNGFKLENPDEKDEKYLFIINEFYNKYADLVSREYYNILKKDLKTSFPSSYNVPEAKKSSTTDSDSFFDEFRYFFLARLVKKYSPLNKLPVPKGAMIIGNHRINIK